MVYKCSKCGAVYKELPRKMTCPVKDCGNKIFYKVRPPIIKRVKAI